MEAYRFEKFSEGSFRTLPIQKSDFQAKTQALKNRKKIYHFGIVQYL